MAKSAFIYATFGFECLSTCAPPMSQIILVKTRTITNSPTVVSSSSHFLPRENMFSKEFIQGNTPVGEFGSGKASTN